MDGRFEKLFRDGTQSRSGPNTRACRARVKSVNVDSRTLTAIVSSEHVDRDGEIILKEAFKESLPGFLKNPVVLAGHMHRLGDGPSPVVGNITSARIVKEGLFCEIYFHDLTELANEYWDLYSNKIQTAFSVGFIPLEGERRNVEGKWVYVHTKVELLEVSCVAVPSNRQALSRSAERRRGFVEAKRQESKYDDGGDLADGFFCRGKYADAEKYPWLQPTAEELRQAAEFQEKIDLLTPEELEAYIDGRLDRDDESGDFELSETGYGSGDESRFADLFI